jgi:hypothetical protein
MARQDRRAFLGMAAAASLLPLDLDAQAPPAPRAPAELARHALTGPLEGFEVVLIELNNPPAAPAGQRPPNPHRHPGPVLGYILEGQMRFAINHEPEKALPVGATFFEPTGALHTGGGSASTQARARALVFMIVPKGAPLVVPA